MMVVSDSAEIAKKTVRETRTRGDEYISVVIPCYNEERYISKALNNLAGQYDNSLYEIIVVDGMSSDKTRDAIAEFMKSHPGLSIRIIDNPARNIPTALNLGIAAAQGGTILRMDAHAVPSIGYVRRCVELVKTRRDTVVGAPCIVCPGSDTLMARAIAIGVSHPFGIGDATYRLRNGVAPQESVDTVAFGAFSRRLWQELGGFNEELLTNEDYDFNYRVRKRGGDVLLDRAEHCDYFARTSLSELGSQYFRYGQWKARMLKLHPKSIRWRHLVAPSFVCSIIVLGLAGIFWHPAWLLLTLEFGAYIALALILARQSGPAAVRLTLLMPFVFLTIHLSWGVSFLLGLIGPSLKRSH